MSSPIPTVTPRDSTRSDPTPPIASAIAVFFPAWGCLMLTAFVSVALQMETTFGREGLAPMVDARMPLWAQPALVRILPFDATIWGLLVLGAAATCAMMVGYKRPVTAWIVAACWFQVSVSSPRLLGWQPDVLILHGSIAAALLAGRASREGGRWLALLILAKLYLDAGLVKLLDLDAGGIAGWVDQGFSTSFFEITAIPGPLARFWHNTLTPTMTTAGAMVVAIGQVVAVVAMFVGSRARLAAWGFLFGFQLFLVTSTNFGALGWGALVLSVLLIDDRWWPARLRQILAASPIRAPEDAATGDRFEVSARTTKILIAVWVLAQVVQTVTSLGNLGDSAPAKLGQAWRLSARYAMFNDVPEVRYDWRFVAVSESGEDQLEVLALPDQLDLDATGGRFLFAHHPRVAFMLWFMSSMGEAVDPKVLSSGFADPPDQPERTVEMSRRFAAWLCRRGTWGPTLDTRWIRLDVVRLEFTSAEQSRWWAVEPVGRSRPVRCDTLVD